MFRIVYKGLYTKVHLIAELYNFNKGKITHVHVLNISLHLLKLGIVIVMSCSFS